MQKQVRKFQCRDDLWARVEALANRRGVSTDEIIQGALVQVFSRKRAPGASNAAGSSAAVRPPASARRTIPALRDPSEMTATLSSGGTRGETPEHATTLYLMVGGKSHTVDIDEFIIGRAPRACSLAIKDPNISRTHCKIVREGGKFFIRDLGSTNGIEFEGKRVDNHRVEEGAVYFLCDHKVRCTYSQPS